MFRRHWSLIVGGVVYLLCDTDEALAWGPATHIELAKSLIGQLPILPAAVATLISRWTADFIYGNVAADVIFAKRFCQAKRHCHHWANGLALLDQAPDDRGRSFALGYLCHLAADVVAHNKFVPRQITVARSTTNFGHIYWEMRGDSYVDPNVWGELRSLLRTHFPAHDALMSAELSRTIFSFQTNQRIFHHSSLLTSADSWQRGVKLWSRVSRRSLEASLVANYHDECVDRMISVLTRGPSSAVLHEDPVGAASLKRAKFQRRQLRQMSRAGILDPYVLQESTAALEPNREASANLTDDPEGLAAWIPVQST
jgi:hypothetical protein